MHRVPRRKLPRRPRDYGKGPRSRAVVPSLRLREQRSYLETPGSTNAKRDRDAHRSARPRGQTSSAVLLEVNGIEFAPPVMERVPGRWERTPRPYAHWVPGHWRHSAYGWYWAPGHWRG